MNITGLYGNTTNIDLVNINTNEVNCSTLNSSSTNTSNINVCSLTIPNNSITQNKIIDLVSDLDDKQDNIDLVAGTNMTINYDSNNTRWTFNSTGGSGNLAGSANIDIGNNIVSLKDPCNLSTLSVSNIFITDGITIPASSIPQTKITDLVSDLDDKQDIIDLVGGTNMTITYDSNNTRWTFNADAGSLSGSTNIDITNDVVSLKDDIYLTNVNTSTLNICDIVIPNNKIAQNKIVNLGNDLSNKQDTLAGSSNINVASNIVSLKNDINLSNVNTSNLNVCDIVIPNNKIAQSKIIDLGVDLGNKQDTLSGSSNINIASNVVSLKNDINLTNVNTSTLNICDIVIPNNKIAQNKIVNLGNDLSNKQDTLSGSSNINIASNIVSLKNDINLTDVNTSNLNVCDIVIPNNKIAQSKIIDLGVDLGNKQDNISLIAGDNIVINYDSNNTSWTIEGDTTIMKTQTLNTSTINSSTMNSSSLSVVNLITCNDLNVASEITTHTASFRTINTSYCNSLNASFDDLNASSSNISNITIGTLTGQNTNSVNMNVGIFNSDDITCDDFTLDTNGIMKIKSNSVRGQLSATNNKFNISCSTSQYISFANGNSEICNIHSDKVDINVSTNISGALNASYYLPITAGSVSSDNMRVEELFVNDTGIITFSAGTGGSGGGSIKTLPNEGLNISCGNQLNKGIFLTKGTDKKIEIEELVKINVSTNISGLITTNTISSTLINSSTSNSSNINASNLNVSTFNIGTTNFTTLNASSTNTSSLTISSPDFIALDMTREINSNVGGCMIQLQKSHATGSSPDAPWRFGASGGTGYTNHFIIEPNNVPHGRCLDLDNNGVLKLSGANAVNNFENYEGALVLRSPTSAYIGGHFGKYIQFTGTFYDTPRPPFSILLMPRLNDSYRNNLVIYDTARQLGVVINHSGNTGHAFKVNGSCFCTANAWSGSDDRIKYNEEDVEGLNVIRKLNPKKYDKLSIMGEKYTDDSSYNSWMPPSDISFNEDPSKYEHSKECGLIAQDILDTDISYCVNQDISTDSAFEMYSVDYNSIFNYAIQAIKELDVKMNNLEAENSLLLSRVAELENNI